MGSDGRRGLALLGGAAILGISADVLFQGRPLGLNVFVFAAAFVAALAVVLRVSRAPLHQGRRWMVAPLLLFAAAFAWHDSPLLVATNALALVAAIALGSLRRSRPRPQDATVGDYAAGLVAAGVGTFAGSIDLLEREVPWDDALRGVRSDRAAALGRGLAIGLPFLAIFGGLFVAADAVFRRLVEAALPSGLTHLWSNALIALVAAWASAGLLRDLVAPREAARVLSAERLVERRPAMRIGGTEIAVALLLLDLLFLIFVLVQARYLFGGSDVVLSTQHLTYAQYARHGFFELLAVSVLVVPVVLAANALARTRTRLIGALSAVLVLLELAVAASALQRMHVYVDRYGLTELRVYVSGVILWIAAVLVWSLATVVRGQARRFAVGAVVAGFAATIALNVANPDALIARTNIDRGRIDPHYLAGLSDDAVPALIAGLDRLPAPQRREIARALLARRFDGDPLVWNASRAQARAAIAGARDRLGQLASHG